MLSDTKKKKKKNEKHETKNNGGRDLPRQGLGHRFQLLMIPAEHWKAGRTDPHGENKKNNKKSARRAADKHGQARV